LWDDVLDAVKQRSKSAHAMLNQYAQVGAVDAKTVTLTFTKAAVGKQFEARSDFFRDALREVAGIDLTVRVTADDDPGAGTRGSSMPPERPRPPSAPATRPDPDPTEVVDLTNDDDDGDEPAPSNGPAEAVALLQSELSAQVIDRIDGT
jgi:DNA polymerase-3 subunit gamma/tau